MQSAKEGLLNPPSSQEISEQKLAKQSAGANIFSPRGECLPDDTSYYHERSPTRVASNRLNGPQMRDDHDNWEFQRPGTLATTQIYGDTVKNNIIEKCPHFSEDSLTIPLMGSKDAKVHMDESADAIIDKAPQPPGNQLDDETVFLLSSASLMTDGDDKVIEPVTAKVQYHRRKRLEWRVDNSLPRSSEARANADTNSWTVYDDLLEELEENLEHVAYRKEQSGHPEKSDSSNVLGIPTPTELSAIIEKYLNQKFFEFNNRTEIGYGYCSPYPPKSCTDAGIMTGLEEKEEEEPSLPKQVKCLPKCKCVAPTKKRR